MTTATSNAAIAIPVEIDGTIEDIALTRPQAIALLALLSDPNEVDQIVRYLRLDLGLDDELVEIAPDPVPAPTPIPATQPTKAPTLPALNTGTVTERIEAARRHQEACKASQQPAPTAPTAPKVETIAPKPTPAPVAKPKTPRRPRRVKTPIVIVDTLAPIAGISALPGKPLPTPTATCAVSTPSPTPSAKTGTGAEKIDSAAMERDTLNERLVADLRQRAAELGLKCHKTKGIGADTLRARIAVAEAKLEEKPVAAPVKPSAPPAPVKTARKAIANFVNRLPDGRDVWTVVYEDGTFYNEISRFAADAVAA